MAKRASAPRLSARAFLKQVADELPSHLPPRLRDFSSEQWGRFYKVWYGDEKKIHFEAQFIAGGRLEIGLHLESDPDTNERLASALEKKEAVIRRALGDEPRFGSHGGGWRSLFERWPAGDLRNEEAATEAAARLAEYMVAVGPMLPVSRGVST
jgi:hypothetical protein